MRLLNSHSPTTSRGWLAGCTDMKLPAKHSRHSLWCQALPLTHIPLGAPPSCDAAQSIDPSQPMNNNTGLSRRKPLHRPLCAAVQRQRGQNARGIMDPGCRTHTCCACSHKERGHIQHEMPVPRN